ncbi:Cytosolic iron-sulfur protein assembly protein [Purpureocillium takamizusanense]|uniref:Probable cytosolic iron-sulfur protein assembly protein 1 n=1 Tax=Purpureocillium takamizusanense TaxID=2060973 RepID=A0A9Q8QAS9_9HYPO|nr:Cytosolic iron-sulfur protein assembly protein [Purpureocillium takamizusanense]UNI16215.1 Cytosolic iron-sulfur protein assembly protein [Purpureocillium takamizusanense]
MAAPPPSEPRPSSTPSVKILPLRPFQPDLHERAWASVPHPTLPLLATAHSKSATVFSLATLSSHSSLTGGHTRSVRSVAWKPGLPPHKLCLVTGSFDSTAGLWRWDGDTAGEADGSGTALETEVTARGAASVAAAAALAGDEPDHYVGGGGDDDDDSDRGADGKDWEFTLVLEGHDSEIKSCAFSPSGAYLATCSRDKSVWIWEDIGTSDDDDEWETVAVLNEHEGDVKAVAWCPDVPGRNARRRFSPDVLASASYDNTLRVWREDGDGEWVCVAVLEGHDGTVWGVQWEPRPSHDRFPRLLSHSADGTIRIWTLKDDDDEEEDGNGGGGGGRNALGGIPNTMRRSLREEWTCTAVLPKAHGRDIYSVAWSGESGLVASTGSDGIVALYKEVEEEGSAESNQNDGQLPVANGQEASGGPSTTSWELLATQPGAHGPYEVNHVTWCRRYDAGSSRRGEEEMLVTTGDDGVVRPWEVRIQTA